jgi:hypothetical protein
MQPSVPLVARTSDHQKLLNRTGENRKNGKRFSEEYAMAAREGNGGNGSDPRVRFESGLPAHIMAIDATWLRDCVINDVSDMDATLTIPASIERLRLEEFFLVLSSTGPAYRRCSLAWVNGNQIGVRFLFQKGRKERSSYDPEKIVH